MPGHDVRGTRRPGTVREITAVSNPVIKSIRALSHKRHRDEEGVFIAEGLQLATFALESGWRANYLIYAKHMRSHDHLMETAARARASGAHILEVSEKVLAAISRRDNPQMVIGVFQQQWHDGAELVRKVREPGDVLVALDRIRDPGNLGTIVRTADAAGASGVLLIGETTDPFSVEAVRATMGSIFNLPIARAAEADFIAMLAGFAGRKIGTHLSGAVDYRSLDYTKAPSILVMGNEQQGLGGALAAACSDLALIPMSGRAESLNLAIATGIMLFEARRPFLGAQPIDVPARDGTANGGQA